MNELTPDLLQQKMLAFGALLPRISAAVVLLPVMAPKLVTPIVRNGFCIAVLSAAVWFGEEHTLLKSFGIVEFLFFVLREAFIGAAIGISFALVFAVGGMIGEFVDQQTGLTFTQNVDPVNGQNVSTTAIFIEKLWLVCFVSTGGLLLFCDVVLSSYWYWPISKPMPDIARLLSTLLIGEVAQLFSLAVLLAAPILLSIFLVDIGLGMLGKAAPPLNLFALGNTAKPMIALLVLLVALPFMLRQGVDAMQAVAGGLSRLFEGRR